MVTWKLVIIIAAVCDILIGATVTAAGLPDAVTNRIFSITLQLEGKNLSLFSRELVVRPLLVSSGKQVGSVGMAINADLDRATGCVKLQPGDPSRSHSF